MVLNISDPAVRIFYLKRGYSTSEIESMYAMQQGYEIDLTIIPKGVTV